MDDLLAKLHAGPSGDAQQDRATMLRAAHEIQRLQGAVTGREKQGRPSLVQSCVQRANLAVFTVNFRAIRSAYHHFP
jgi:hypothetical protein